MTRRNSGRNYCPPSTQTTATFLSCPFEPLALIEYWAVDPDYDGKVFRSIWQYYRGYTANHENALRVVTHAAVTTAL